MADSEAANANAILPFLIAKSTELYLTLGAHDATAAALTATIVALRRAGRMAEAATVVARLWEVMCAMEGSAASGDPSALERTYARMESVLEAALNNARGVPNDVQTKEPTDAKEPVAVSYTHLTLPTKA